MLKKFSLIFLLAVALGAFLVLRPYLFKKVELPSLEDRLPDGDFIGRAYVLDVARETSAMMYYNKIPFRDLFSYEFILSQGKQYGLNLQDPVYFFAYENGNWGAVAQVSDSSKIREGIERLRKFIEIKDTLFNDQHVYTFKREKGYLTYSNNYVFLYKGDHFEKMYHRVTKAKRRDTSPTWRLFLREKQFRNEKLVIYSNWSGLKANGIKTALFAHDSDSISFRLKAYFRSEKPLNFSMKSSGLNFRSGEYVSKMLNVHLNISKLRNAPDDPLYQWMVLFGKRISFPTKEFLDAWEGDLSYRQGGFQTLKETYIESVLDEDFNVSEVQREKEVKVPGFSLMLSTNEKDTKLLNKLFEKGILTNENNQLRFLFSPPLKMQKKGSYYFFYSGDFIPKTEEYPGNDGIWLHKGTNYQFSIDSIKTYEVFGSVYIPVDRIIRRSRFF